MRINLLHDYGGRLTSERRIEPGVYDAGDPALFGLATYLVENGHAVVVEEQATPAVETSVTPEPFVKEVVLDTLAELLDQAEIGEPESSEEADETEPPSQQEAADAIYSAEDVSAAEFHPEVFAPTGRKSRKG